MRNRGCLFFASIWVHFWFLSDVVLHIFVVFCVVFFYVFVLWRMLPLYLGCSFLSIHSVFSKRLWYGTRLSFYVTTQSIYRDYNWERYMVRYFVRWLYLTCKNIENCVACPVRMVNDSVIIVLFQWPWNLKPTNPRKY